MWENQLGVRRHFLLAEQKVVHPSKLGFPISFPAILVIAPDHGLEALWHKKSRIARGHLEGGGGA
jgi:hypothetical protein